MSGPRTNQAPKPLLRRTSNEPAHAPHFAHRDRRRRRRPVADRSTAPRAAPPAGKQAPGFYRHKVGSFEVTAVNDGARTFPMPDTFVRKQARRRRRSPRLESVFMPKGMMTIPFTPMVVNTGSKLVLIDTGNGPRQGAKGAVGLMDANMAAAGIDPKTVDIVIISHFHGDHINGLRNADGCLVYPNAEIKVPAAEWAFWMDEATCQQGAERLHEGRTSRT